jgi:hypothetical protein
MRFWSCVILIAGLTAIPSTARADDSATSSGWALASAGAIDVTGFIVGGMLLARGGGDHLRDNAGWLTIESGFVLSPVAAHGVSGEWGRGALFALVPLATLAVTTALFEAEPDTVESGTLPQQRWMWAMFGGGLFASAVGVVDALWAPGRAPARARALVIRPAVARDQFGLQIGGTL